MAGVFSMGFCWADRVVARSRVKILVWAHRNEPVAPFIDHVVRIEMPVVYDGRLGVGAEVRILEQFGHGCDLHQITRLLACVRRFLPIPPAIERNHAFKSEVSANVESTLLVPLL